MSDPAAINEETRRDFLTSSASGLGAVALGSLLAQERLFPSIKATEPTPLPHTTSKAKACIFIFMAGAPSQLDLFDPKPQLKALHGEKLPTSIINKARFAFIKPETATLMGSPRTFRKYGQSGMELADILPHLGNVADELLLVRSMHSTEFNHHPGQLAMQCGVSRFGMPSMGSWINYGLGSPSNNLPGYVVLTAGRGSSGGATLWQSGFLPSSYSGVLFRNQGEPVLNLKNPKGVTPSLQAKTLETINALNKVQYDHVRDPEIASRIKNFELAGRMQTAAPELIDLSGETQATLDTYGVGRPEPKERNSRGTLGHLQTYDTFARNCLLARRMVERGVRFVNIIHASWDAHSSLDREITYNAGAVDKPIAALIKDLKQRGMLDETMVVWGSEFGRTPLGENRPGRESNTGRDHHPMAYSMFLAGGGIKGGQVYGKTDEIGWNTVENPVSVHDLHATMLHCFGINHRSLTYRFQGRDFRLTDVAGNVIPSWLV